MLTLESLKLEGRPADIPDCGRDDLPKFFIDMGFKVGVEIGTAKGEFAEKLCKAGLILHCIDPYMEYEDYSHPGIQERLDAEYVEAKKRLSHFSCQIFRETSMEALKHFADDSLDFVYIDGHHGFKYVAEDICEWTKKVRKGGIIAGHDYFILKRPYREQAYVLQVKEVVDAYTRAMRMKRWWVLGRREKIAGEKRDPFRSFMWIKE